MADRAGRDPDAHLSFLRRVEDEVLDLERRAERPADRGPHDEVGGKRDCWSRSATSIVFRVYCCEAARDGWKSHG